LYDLRQRYAALRKLCCMKRHETESCGGAPGVDDFKLQFGVILHKLLTRKYGGLIGSRQLRGEADIDDRSSGLGMLPKNLLEYADRWLGGTVHLTFSHPVKKLLRLQC